MKQKWTRRMLAIILGVCLIVTVLTGCNTPTTAPSITASVTAKPTGIDLSKKVPLVIAMQSNPNIVDLEKNWFTTYLEQKLNVDLSFVLLAADTKEARTKISLMFSSGEKLPDIINLSLDQVAVGEYGARGTLVDLSAHYADPVKMPKFNAISKDTKALILSSLKSADGKIYGLPRYLQVQVNEAAYRAQINIGWLSKVGMQMPTTTDEFKAVLKAFVDKDANGNSKKDEIGVVGATGWAQNPIPFFMNAFINANPDKGYFDVKNGKIIASFAQPEWKEGLAYMNSLVNEGLFSPLGFTQDSAQLKALINVAGGMVGVFTSGSYASMLNYDIVGEPNKGTGYRLLPPLKGPKGVVGVAQNPTIPQNFWNITKSCADVDRAVALGDYFLDNTTSIISQWGEPDVDWSAAPAVVEKYFITEQLVKAGYAAEFAILNAVWGTPSNKSWQSICPMYRLQPANAEWPNILKTAPAAQGTGTYKTGPDFNTMYLTQFRKASDVIVALPYVGNEATDLANIKAVIDTYVNEQAVAFITGKRSLNEWDAYLSQLDKMGLKKYIEINQAAYDRFKG